MKKLAAVMMFLLITSIAQAQLTKLLDQLTDFEISWDGGGSWIAYDIVTYSFSTDAPSPHNPFATFGLNRFEADITDVIAGDTDTLARWDVVVDDPGIVPESIWVVGWFHWRIRVEAEGQQDTSEWSEMEVCRFKRPKKPPKPKVVRF